MHFKVNLVVQFNRLTMLRCKNSFETLKPFKIEAYSWLYRESGMQAVAV